MGMSKTEQQEDNVVLGESYPAEDITSPDHTDVLLGRGAGVNKHPGNKYFRDIVKQYQDDYLVAKNNYEKYLTSMEILKALEILILPVVLYCKIQVADYGMMLAMIEQGAK